MKRPKPGSYHEIEGRILRAVRKSLCISRADIASARRSRDLTFVRQAIMYWAARRTSLSYPQIGRRMGGRDHTPVLHGKDRYVELRAKMGRTLRKVR